MKTLIFCSIALIFLSGCVTVQTDTPTLLRYLKNNNYGLRAVGAELLGIKKAKEAVPDLISVLISDENPAVRYEAAVALGKIGDPSALPYLTKALEDPGFHEEKFPRKERTIKKVKDAAFEAIKLIRERKHCSE